MFSLEQKQPVTLTKMLTPSPWNDVFIGRKDESQPFPNSGVTGRGFFYHAVLCFKVSLFSSRLDSSWLKHARGMFTKISSPLICFCCSGRDCKDYYLQKHFSFDHIRILQCCMFLRCRWLSFEYVYIWRLTSMKCFLHFSFLIYIHLLSN